MKFETKGLVIRETSVKDNDRYLDVLTAEHGRISVYARGVRSFKSKNMGATQPMCYSIFTLDRQREDFIVLSEASKIEAYGELSSGLEANALCMYVCDVVREFALPGTDCTNLLRLTLNTLHAASNALYPIEIIKSAFEMRIMSDEGYMPDLSGCSECGERKNDIYLDVMNGSLVCSSCLNHRPENIEEESGTSTILSPLSLTSIDAMRYIMSAPLNRLFAFKLEGQYKIEMCTATQTYLLNHLEKGFATLDFYNQVVNLNKKTT